MTIEQINGFHSWWKVNGHYPGKAALKSFLDNFGSYVDGVNVNQNGKPRRKTAEEQIAETLKEMGIE